MKELFYNQQVDCYLQEGASVTGKESLVGALTKTAVGFRFEQEAKIPKIHTRNPKIFDNKHISLVRRRDKSLKFSFKELEPNANLDKFAYEVYCEIQNALQSIQ